MMSDNNNNDLYGLGSITSFGDFHEEQSPIRSDPPELRLSPSAISDAASIIAAEFRRRTSSSIAGKSTTIRDRIASHPLFPKLLGVYLDCRKVGAPPEIAGELEEIRRDNGESLIRGVTVNSDPELDDFMETYCEILVKYKSDLSRPFDEATTFLGEMQAQLNDLISNPGASTSYVSDHEGVCNNSSEEELSRGEIEVVDDASNISRQVIVSEDRELKEKLMRKYSGYISSLKNEFSKKKKKGKLPKEARQVLLDWWTLHYRWPYPTERDKKELGEVTGLDEKQINNWFINQRKRHWKPPENMHVAIMDAHSLYTPFYNH